MDILHPTDTNRKLEELERRLAVLESHPQGYTQSGGQLVVGADGRLSEIQNTSGSSIIDSQGLVSTTNFVWGSYFATNQITTNSTSPVDISGSSLQVNLPRTANVLFFIAANMGHQSNPEYGGIVYLYLNIDGDDDSNTLLTGYPVIDETNSYPTTDTNSYSLPYIKQLASGNHTVKLRWYSGTSSSNAFITRRQLVCIILGV